MASTQSRAGTGRTSAMVLLSLGLVTMLAGGAWAGEKKAKDNNGANATSHEDNGKGKGRPPGNNGTVKIDGVPLKAGKGNEPHVGCDFNVEFYNYDEGDYDAAVIFELQAPTLRDGGKKADQVLLTDEVFIGEDPAGGGNDLDASEAYRLDFDGVEAHPKQGYHVKLTVHAPGSQGADKKHKVFWVECAEPPPTTTTTAPPTTTTTQPPTTTTTQPPTTTTTQPPTTTTTAAPTTTTTAPAVIEPTAIETTTTTAPAVLGAVETRPTALARTGNPLQTLLFLGGLVMTLAGLALLGGNAGRGRAQLT